MPYIYTLAGMTHFNDYTIMRPLIMDFNGDPEIYKISDQYMFGPSLMVAPVYKYKARSREVYLPVACGWYDFYTGKYINGGQRFIAEAPYEKLPLFVREGTILPVGPEIQYTGDKKADPLIIFVYTGKDCEFKLYEDEGSNYNYEKGSYSNILFSYNEAKRELRIAQREGSFSGMLKTRTFKIVFISKEKMVTFDPEITPDATIAYDGKAFKVIQPD
jgi:alpha-D-xyloside xylohydrolase